MINNDNNNNNGNNNNNATDNNCGQQLSREFCGQPDTLPPPLPFSPSAPLLRRRTWEQKGRGGGRGEGAKSKIRNLEKSEIRNPEKSQSSVLLLLLVLSSLPYELV